ncbi:biotin-dependent carboxyltransferase family protein [Pantoea sp.]|uniref:5-oxoprolinase subunit C family protein n=1 Tax=Pantoea sp. TaxID=69393 RepID=UPI0028B25E52|nr:biotin-dependent carboxyltransferase family protein [Pantoea sp.]
MSLEVLHPGMASSLQDEGRYGYQQAGVPVCGAMDRYSHRLANLLVGNQHDCASLEITLLGPRLRFWRRAVIALCGADLSPHIDGQPVPMQQAISVPAGAVLGFGQRRQGARAYLAVHGGFHVSLTMNSHSTCLMAQFGGFAGRYLRQGDHLVTRSAFANATPRVLPFNAPALFPREQQPIRLMAGRHWQQLSADMQQRFLAAVYRIGQDSNRMGYRLEGAAITREHARELASEAVDYGTVQLPPDGQPIILMADAQTTGGYPKIAHVASVDLPRLAQMLPGDEIQFRLISVDQAQQLAIERAAWLNALCT